MKKLILLLSAVTLLSCNNDDSTPETHEFRDSLTGYYKIKAAYTEQAIDLNGDNIPQTDLFLEADCYDWTHLEYYMASFNWNDNYTEYKYFDVEVPNSDYSNYYESYTTCLQGFSLSYQVDLNEETKEITIISRNSERESLYGSVTDILWENGIIHFIVSNQLYTTNGWQEVTIHLLYEPLEPTPISD